MLRKSGECAFRTTGTLARRLKLPCCGRRVTRADRRRSSRPRNSVAGRSRARSLSRHGSQMAREGIGEPNVHLAREPSLSDAPPLDLLSSTTAAAHLRPPQRSRVRRPAGSQPSAADRSSGSRGVQSQLRSLARAECAADPARAGYDVLRGGVMLRWPQHGCMARRGGSPSWIRPRPCVTQAGLLRNFNPFLRGS